MSVDIVGCCSCALRRPAQTWIQLQEEQAPDVVLAVVLRPGPHCMTPPTQHQSLPSPHLNNVHINPSELHVIILPLRIIAKSEENEGLETVDSTVQKVRNK